MSQRKLMTFSLPHRGKKHELKFLFDLAKGNHATVYRCLTSNSIYEPDISAFFCRILRPGDHALDIGANLGFHSMLMSSLVGPTGLVEAFEPDPINIADIKENVRHNGATNVRLHEMAVGSTESPVRMFSWREDTGWNAVLTGATDQYVSSLDATKLDLLEGIRSDSIDHVCGSGRYRVAKIDVEGYEGKVLDGASGLLARHACDYWVVEYAAHCLEHFNEDQWSIRKRFYEHGYDCFVLSRVFGLPAFVPRTTKIVSGVIINLVFARLEVLERDFRENDFGSFSFGHPV